MNMVKLLQSERVVRMAKGLQLAPSAEANDKSRALREVVGQADTLPGERRKRMGAESTMHWEAYGWSHGASPAEGDLPECPDTLQDQDLSVDRPIPGAISGITPSGHAALNGYSTAPPCLAAATKTSETSGHFPTLCSTAPCSAVLAETSIITQDQYALSTGYTATGPEGRETPSTPELLPPETNWTSSKTTLSSPLLHGMPAFSAQPPRGGMYLPITRTWGWV